MPSSLPHESASHLPPVVRESDEDLFRAGGRFRLLLALADDDVADATIKVADALARTRGAEPAVIQVFDISPYAPPPLLPAMLSFAEAMIGSDAAAERRQAVSERLRRACGRSVTWDIVLRLGDPTACIVDEVHQRGSELLVVGLHTHGRVARLLGAETTVHVLTNAGIPVLAVTPQSSGLPHHLLVAVDFGQTSVRMAKLAARLAEPPGRIVLAYVQTPPPPERQEDTEGEEVIHREGVTAAFDALVRQLEPAPGVAVERVVLDGDPAAVLLAYAEQTAPDLIAVASQRHPFVTRLLLGSVSRTVIRDGRWPVFITP